MALRNIRPRGSTGRLGVSMARLDGSQRPQYINWCGHAQLPFVAAGPLSLVVLESPQLVYGKFERPVAWNAQLVIDPLQLDPAENGTFFILLKTIVGAGKESVTVPKLYTVAPPYQIITDTGTTVADSIQASYRFSGSPGAPANTSEAGIRVTMVIAPIFHEPTELLYSHAMTCDTAMLEMVEILRDIRDGR